MLLCALKNSDRIVYFVAILTGFSESFIAEYFFRVGKRTLLKRRRRDVWKEKGAFATILHGNVKN